MELHYLDQVLLGSWVRGEISQNFNGDLKSIKIECQGDSIVKSQLPSNHQRPLRGSMCTAKCQNILHEQWDMGFP